MKCIKCEKEIENGDLCFECDAELTRGEEEYKAWFEREFPVAAGVKAVEHKMHPTKNGRAKSDKLSKPAVFSG